MLSELIEFLERLLRAVARLLGLKRDKPRPRALPPLVRLEATYVAGNVIVSWVLPTERAPGEPLGVEEIQHVELSLKLKAAPDDKWQKVADEPPDVLSRRFENVPGGTYVVRGIVHGVDEGDVSPPKVAEFTVPRSDMPPLAEITAALE